MITVKYNIDFKKALKQLEKEKLSDTLNEGVADKFAKNSAKFIKAGKVGKLENAPLHDITIRQRKKHFGVSHKKPMLMTGNLANSLKGSKEGIKANPAKFGKNNYKKHREGDFTWSDRPKNPDYKAATDSVVVPKREFITAAIPTEKSANNKIYKEFEKKIVKLLSKSIRKR